jgi:hypothetical protein
MLIKFLSLLHALLCIVSGFLCWYLILWLFTSQKDPFIWSIVQKLFFVLFGSFTSENLRNAKIDVEIKKKSDE